MHKLTTVLENFFEDKVVFFLNGAPIPVYRTRQALSKLGPVSPSKDKGRLVSASSSVSSVYSEELMTRGASVAIGRCTRNLRSRANFNQEQQHDMSEDGESDAESQVSSASSCNEVVQRQTRSMRMIQLPSLSSSESTSCVDEAGHGMRLRTRATERRPRQQKRRAEESESDEEEEDGSGEESDSGEDYVEARPQSRRGKRGRRGQGSKRGPPRGEERRQLRKRRRVSSYLEDGEEEEGEEEGYGYNTITTTSRSGRIVKRTAKFS